MLKKVGQKGAKWGRYWKSHMLSWDSIYLFEPNLISFLFEISSAIIKRDSNWNQN